MSFKPGISAVLNVRNEHLSEKISENIEGRGMFTHVLSADPSKVPKRGLIILCLYDSVSAEVRTYVCVFQKQGNVATAQVRIKGFKFVLIEEIGFGDIISGLPQRELKKASGGLNDGFHRFTPVLGQLLYTTLKELRPDLANRLDELAISVLGSKEKNDSNQQSNRAAEKDALGLILDIYGIDRSEVLNGWNGSVTNLGDSFLKGLTKYSSYEDDAIFHDLHRFPGFENVGVETITGVAEFQNPDGNKLTVINANRKPLEKAMGVDLIYFHRGYESFVLVQYKMMNEKAGNHLYFNPNQPSHDKELSRMKDIVDKIRKLGKGASLKDYRFFSNPFFFKLCKNIEMKFNDSSLVPGMYISLDQWELLLADDSTLGTKGGRQFGYHTLEKRYLTKESFVELVKSGFIGTCNHASTQLAAFIQSAIEMGHTVMYALEDKRIPL